MRTKTPPSSMRKSALGVAALVALATPACFALFSLDGYGPPNAAGDAASDADSLDASDGGDAARRPRTVFVTSQRFTGDLGARDGGDSKCQAAAVDAGLSGSYRVWLSEDNGSAVASLVRDGGPLHLPTGTLVAADLDELARSGPRTGIAIDEKGTKVGGGGCEDGGLVAWTGTAVEGGTRSPLGLDCGRWRTSGTGTGAVGLVGTVGESWTAACTQQCQQRAALYCIQQ